MHRFPCITQLIRDKIIFIQVYKRRLRGSGLSQELNCCHGLHVVLDPVQFSARLRMVKYNTSMING